MQPFLKCQQFMFSDLDSQMFTNMMSFFNIGEML